MKNLRWCWVLAVVAMARAAFAEGGVKSLAGEWGFEMDRGDVGVKEGWFGRVLKEKIGLPGILQGEGFGDEISVETPWVAALPRDMRWYLLPQYQAYTKAGQVLMPYLSQPARHYLGVAWYQKEVEVGQAWAGKRVELFLERPRWETRVWVDDRLIGDCHSLVAPHVYDLGILPVGRHRVSVRVDNRMILPYRPDGHSVSDAEGATWNGIVGRIELHATTPVWIADVQAFPEVEKKAVRLHVVVGNETGTSGDGAVTVGAVKVPVKWDETGGVADVEVSLGADAKVWSEFSPALQHLTVGLTGDGAEDSREVTFGLREITAVGKKILLNGTELDLRATHDGGGFPLTGYPAMDVASWKRIIGICKEWGLNGMRFHSWCPPEAAFEAADEMGFYLQPECGMWNSFDAQGKMLVVLNDETARLIKAYGNHPSFVFLAATNEPAGHYKEQLPTWDKKWEAADPRRLYTDGTGRPAPATKQGVAADYLVSADAGLHGRVRGPGGWFGGDYGEALKGVEVPVIGHEVGQWCAYPDFDVIKKFTGYLRPGNYEIARDFAAAHGLLEENKRLAKASGEFQVLCYKEEMEANLRTAGLSGIELLDLHDYLGQGTALIGVLDAFWESKGYVTAAEFRKFCNSTVVLARVRDRVLTTGETLDVPVEAAHFGEKPLEKVVTEWRVEDAGGKVVKRGAFAARDIPIGKGIELGKVEVGLSGFAAPAMYKLVVGLRGTGSQDGFQNDWKFWVYPKDAQAETPADVLVTSDWKEAEGKLAGGGKVLFVPGKKDLGEDDPGVSATPIFWNRLMNPRGTGFLGLWCDARNAALAGFPTEDHCDWQWVDVMRGARALNMDHLPRGLQPIVQGIDDWNRGYKLGLIYECKVGAGKLMVCSVDLAADRVTAGALRRSLLAYMGSEKFSPRVEVSAGELREEWVSTRTKKRGDSAWMQVQPQAPEVDAPGEGPATGGR
ncbi:MAG: sugar-binding domain-containing protein [Phycisphaerae bacterium]